MSNIEKYPKCHMRTSLGNCDPIGGFCTSVKTDICKALHKVADRPTGEWIKTEHCLNDTGYRRWIEIECPFCGERPTYEFLENMNYCPNCGAKMVREDGEEE